MLKSNLIPKSIFDETFDIDSIGFCTDDNFNQLFRIMHGTIFVSNVGTLRFIPIARQTRINLITVKDPEFAFNEYIKNNLSLDNLHLFR